MRFLTIFSFEVFFSICLHAQLNQGVWPISSSSEPNADVTTSPFGPRMNGTKYQIHYGMDIRATTPLPVHAVLSGNVIAVQGQDVGATGKYVLIQHHGNGNATRYIHLSQVRPLQVGDFVFDRQEIGTSGQTGAALGNPHLHLDHYKHSILPLNDNKDTDNPLLILPHETTAPYQIQSLGFSFQYEESNPPHTQWPPAISFQVYIPKKRLDFNRIEVDIIDATNVEGNNVFSSGVLHQQAGFIQPPGASFVSNQESGVIDLRNRIGYDYGPRGQYGRAPDAVYDAWNGVRIRPAPYPGSDQPGNHIYYIDFFLDQDKLKNLRGASIS